MSELYNLIENLCKEKKTNITTMCKEAGISRAPLSELKMGRSKTLSSVTLSKIASYFGVSVDFLLGNEKEKLPTEKGEPSDDDIKFALFGDVSKEITDEEYEDVLRFAQFIREKKKKK